MNTLEHVSEQIKTLRTNAKLTQDALASELKVATNTISRWETGTYKPDLEDLDKLAKFFKVSILQFFPGQDPSVKPELQALLRAAGNLSSHDLEELKHFAEYRQARYLHGKVKSPKRIRE
ncbi:MAG TPA: helix-turn-helix transcriptional regulator [Candidatus Saccharimonadales bacterium]